MLDISPSTPISVSENLLLAKGEIIERIGSVIAVDPSMRTAIALIDPRYAHVLREDTRFLHKSAVGSVWWSITTLLPPSTRRKIEEEWNVFLKRHASEMRALLEPIAVELLDETATLLKEDLERVLALHKDRIEKLGARYRQEIFKDEIVPLFRREIWPIIRHHGAGPAEVIGKELWSQLPLWGLTWRAIYDSFAHDTPVNVEKRWLDFVRQDAIPVLVSRMDLLLTLTSNILNDIALSPEVDATLRKVLLKLKDDPEFLELLKILFRDVIKENPRLAAYMRAKWEDERVKQALTMAGLRVEELLRRIGDLVLLNEDKTGISAALARVLRTVVLRKDRSYIIVEPGEGAPLDRAAHARLLASP
jgi:hypothetical protein